MRRRRAPPSPSKSCLRALSRHVDVCAILRAFKAHFRRFLMGFRQAGLLVLIAASALTIGVRAQQPSSSAGPGARSPYVAGDKRPQGWAAKDYLNNTLGWPANKPLWNTAKQKLLDG